MFGGLTFMVIGRMCCGILKTDLVLRLAPEEAAASLRQPHTRPKDFTGKPMKSMIYVSAIGTDSDQALATWIGSAVKLARASRKQRMHVEQSRRVALLLQVWPLADQRLQS